MSVVDQYLFELGLFLTVGILASRLAAVVRVPDVVLLLLSGVAIGRSGLGWLNLPPDLPGVQLFVVVGAAYILFRGGTTLEFRVLRSVWLTVALLATLGVLATGFVTAFFAAYLFAIPYAAGLLIAAVVASTDPATLIPILEHIRIPIRLKQTILAESALNDATGAIFTFAVLPVALGSSPEPLVTSGSFLWQAAASIGVGSLGGLAAGLLMAERGWLSAYANPLLLGLVILSYAVAEVIGASGYMAAFTAGLLVGNIQYSRFRAEPSVHERTVHYLDVTAGVFRMFIFVLLGTQLDLRSLLGLAVPALLTVLALMALARPLAVLLCALPDRAAKWTRADLTFLSWSRETGVIPAALVAALAARHAPHMGQIGAVVTLTILVTILVQGSTAGPLARALGLSNGPVRLS